MANILQATFQKTVLFELRIYMILHDYFPLIQWNKSPLVGVMVRQAIVWTNDGLTYKTTHIYASCQWVNRWGMYEMSLESQTKWSALVGLCELHFVDNLFNQPTNQPTNQMATSEKEVLGAHFWLATARVPGLSAPGVACLGYQGIIFALINWGRDKMAAIFQTTISNAFSWII